MSASNRPSRPSNPLDRQSEVRQSERKLPLILDELSHAHPNLLEAITKAVADARRRVESQIAANDDGQFPLFPAMDMTDDRVPARIAHEVVKIARADLVGRNIRFQITDDAIKVLPGEKENDFPWRSS